MAIGRAPLLTPSISVFSETTHKPSKEKFQHHRGKPYEKASPRDER